MSQQARFTTATQTPVLGIQIADLGSQVSGKKPTYSYVIISMSAKSRKTTDINALSKIMGHPLYVLRDSHIKLDKSDQSKLQELMRENKLSQALNLNVKIMDEDWGLPDKEFEGNIGPVVVFQVSLKPIRLEQVEAIVEFGKSLAVRFEAHRSSEKRLYEKENLAIKKEEGLENQEMIESKEGRVTKADKGARAREGVKINDKGIEKEGNEVEEMKMRAETEKEGEIKCQAQVYEGGGLPGEV